jgi:hypothetical protein
MDSGNGMFYMIAAAIENEIFMRGCAFDQAFYCSLSLSLGLLRGTCYFLLACVCNLWELGFMVCSARGEVVHKITFIYRGI